VAPTKREDANRLFGIPLDHICGDLHFLSRFSQGLALFQSEPGGDGLQPLQHARHTPLQDFGAFAGWPLAPG
jgi:hypothetical protein